MEKDYKTKCRDLQVLHWESGLEPLPILDSNFKTFVPSENDLALVEDVEYIFKSGSWVIKENKENGED